MLKTKLEVKNKISFKSSRGEPTLAMRLWFLESWWHYNWNNKPKRSLALAQKWQTGMVRTGLKGPTTTTNDTQTFGVVCHTLELSLAQTWPMGMKETGQTGPQGSTLRCLPYPSPQPTTDRHQGWFVDCVASFFSASSLRKLKREQKEGRMVGGGGGVHKKETSPSPSSPPFF